MSFVLIFTTKSQAIFIGYNQSLQLKNRTLSSVSHYFIHLGESPFILSSLVGLNVLGHQL